MLFLIERAVINTRLCFFRCMSTSTNIIYRDEDTRNESSFLTRNVNKMQKKEVKSLKIAILGMPNVGKSTLINQLVQRPVCAASSKVHTTRVKCHAIYSHEDTQLIFIDTPGLVSDHEWKKFQLEPSFKKDAKESLLQADIIGVIQDVGNIKTRGRLNEHIIDLLKHAKEGVSSILILNKVDMIKRKDVLLELVNGLTSKRNWPHFLDIFMISALMKEGTDDLRNYLLHSATPRTWDYGVNVFTDQSTEILIQQIIRSKLMDNLPHELPYKITAELEYLNVCLDGSMDVIVVVKCPTDRISKLTLGKGGVRIKAIALGAEQEMCNAFKTAVRLKVVVEFKDTNK